MSALQRIWLRCPACGSPDQLEILAATWLRVTAFETEATDIHEYGPTSLVTCDACKHFGELRTFEVS